jgi:hypothetical protein
MAGNPCNEPNLQALCGVSDRDRFELELEFVECLANPEYLNWLAQTQHFEDPDFINFLDYLKYWQKPEYCHFITCDHLILQFCCWPLQGGHRISLVTLVFISTELTHTSS